MSQAPPRRHWQGFFLVLSILGVAALTIPVVYNLSLQLRPEPLAHARELWRRAAPVNYDLKWLELLDHGAGEEKYEYTLEVRGGRPQLLSCNGELLYAEPGLAVLAGPGFLALPQENPQRYGVEAMFDLMDGMLRQDASVGGRNYCTAAFDPRDGHPLRLVHRVRGAGERLEWIVRVVEPGGR